MDKFVTRPKRKNPSLEDEKPVEKKSKDSKQLKKEPKPAKIDKIEKKPTKKEPKSAKDEQKPAKKETKPSKDEQKPAKKEAKPSESATKDKAEDAKMKEKLRAESRMTNEQALLDRAIPTLSTRDKSKPISDEDLEKLFFALCGDTGKDYDSDDSIISEIDHMDAEEIARRDKEFRDAMIEIRKLPAELQSMMELRRIGNETPAEKEERRRKMREFTMTHKTESEKEKAEKKRLAAIKKIDKQLNKVVQVFKGDHEKVKQLKNGSSLISCHQLSRCLEVMAECVGADGKGEDNFLDVRKTVKEIDTETFEKSLRSMGIRTTSIFCGEKETLADYLKKKVRKMFCEADILDVIDGDKYGFDLTTKDCILALHNYYNLHKPATGDNGSSATPLGIKIRHFVTCCFYVARDNDKDFKTNENLKYVMFG